jgi:hypothetical protein
MTSLLKGAVCGFQSVISSSLKYNKGCKDGPVFCKLRGNFKISKWKLHSREDNTYQVGSKSGN